MGALWELCLCSGNVIAGGYCKRYGYRQNANMDLQCISNGHRFVLAEIEGTCRLGRNV